MNIIKHETNLNIIESPRNLIEHTDNSDVDDVFNSPHLKVHQLYNHKKIIPLPESPAFPMVH